MSVVKSKRGQGKLTKCFEAWKAHANKGNSYNLTRSMEKYYINLWKEQDL